MEAGISATIAGGPPLAVPSEAETFAELYERCFTRVYGYVASLLRDRSAAEDVTAQAFERAYRKRSSYRPGRGSTEAWLFGSPATPRSTSCAGASATRRSRRARGPHAARSRRAGRARAQARRRARRARHPRPRERDLVALKFAGGLSNAEIARVLGTTESNVGTRLHRTVTKLRKACDELA